MSIDKPHIIYIKRPNYETISDLQKLHFAAIPPVNTNISFNLPNCLYADQRKYFQIKDVPENFSWRDITPEDSEEIKRKKKLIYPVLNQELCGSCYAMVVAQAISDTFVISGIVDYFPDISTTYALACYGQGKCNGGNPGKLLQEIAKGGISDNNCLNYDWCTDNKQCTSKDTLIKNHDLNLLIPDCKCKNSPYKLYFIDEYMCAGSIETNRELYFAEVKNHIYQIGPTIAGFNLKTNFISGNFTKINNGIYFENGIYDEGNTIKFKDYSLFNYLGGHSVCVMGWGVEKNTVIDNQGTKADVPYWYCRNTWGKDWGYDGGYFKIATTPYNENIQFDVKKNDPNSLGGQILFYASKPPITVNNKRENYENKTKSNSNWMLLIILVLIFLLIFIR